MEELLRKEYLDLTSDEEKNIVREFICQMQLEFQNNCRNGIYAKIQKMMAYNSNKIEGSTLTSEQTASLFDTGTLYSSAECVYKSKDIEEMTGHFTMFNHMLKTLDCPLTEKLIKEFHYALKAGVFEDIANGYPIGEYKNRFNVVSDIETYSPKEIPDAVQNLLAEYETEEHTVQSFAKFHAKFEKIHPFQDGNGRTGRIILFKQCLQNERMPIIIKDEDKLEYYHVLHVAQVEGNFEPLTKFFVRQQVDYYNTIKFFLMDYGRTVPGIKR